MKWSGSMRAARRRLVILAIFSATDTRGLSTGLDGGRDRAATRRSSFELPVPDAIILAAGEVVGVEEINAKLGRLQGLGLIDRFALESAEEASLMVNALARPLFEALPPKARRSGDGGGPSRRLPRF